MQICVKIRVKIARKQGKCDLPFLWSVYGQNSNYMQNPIKTKDTQQR